MKHQLFYRSVGDIGVGIYSRIEFSWVRESWYWRLSTGPITISWVR